MRQPSPTWCTDTVDPLDSELDAPDRREQDMQAYGKWLCGDEDERADDPCNDG